MLLEYVTLADLFQSVWVYRLIAHLELQHTATGNLFMGDPKAIERLAIQGDGLNIDILRAIVMCDDGKALAWIKPWNDLPADTEVEAPIIGLT